MKLFATTAPLQRPFTLDGEMSEDEAEEECSPDLFAGSPVKPVLSAPRSIKRLTSPPLSGPLSQHLMELRQPSQAEDDDIGTMGSIPLTPVPSIILATPEPPSVWFVA